MPNSTRLQHLLNALQGDAAPRVKGMEIINSNYQVAWDRLLRRYDNRFIRLATHIEALIICPLLEIVMFRILLQFQTDVKSLSKVCVFLNSLMMHMIALLYTV